MNGCYMILVYGGSTSNAVSIELPCYPDELKDSISSQWSNETILGRSSPLAAYGSTGFRSVSFGMTLHREMENNTSLEGVLQTIRKTVYPLYTTKGLRPPLVRFVFGSFVANGYVESVNYSWNKPVIDGLYQICNISVDMKCIPTKVFSSSELGSSVNPFNDSSSAGIITNRTIAEEAAFNSGIESAEAIVSVFNNIFGIISG